VKWKFGGPSVLSANSVYTLDLSFTHSRGGELLNWAIADVHSMGNLPTELTDYDVSIDINGNVQEFTRNAANGIIYENGFTIEILNGDVLTYDANVHIAVPGGPIAQFWGLADVVGFVPAGGGGPPSEPTAPKVSNVIIGTTATYPYGSSTYAFDAVDGSGEQLRTVPVGAANKISIQFTEDVHITETEMQLIALNRVLDIPSVQSFVEPDSTNGYTATWTLSAPLQAAQYLIKLQDTVIDSGGIALDGEWTNPKAVSTSSSDTFPSGDGAARGDFEFLFTILPGDMNRDNSVNFGDVSAFGAALTNPTSINPQVYPLADINLEGSVNFGDSAPFSSILNGPAYLKILNTISILANLQGNDFDVDSLDETTFQTYYGAQNTSPTSIRTATWIRMTTTRSMSGLGLGFLWR
jgi:hypothetical protein